MTLDEYLDSLTDEQIEELADKVTACYRRTERWCAIRSWVRRLLESTTSVKGECG